MNKNLNSRTLNSVNNKQNEWITHFWPSLQGKDNKESLMKGVSSRFISLLILLALLHFRVSHYNYCLQFKDISTIRVVGQIVQMYT